MRSLPGCPPYKKSPPSYGLITTPTTTLDIDRHPRRIYRHGIQTIQKRAPSRTAIADRPRIDRRIPRSREDSDHALSPMATQKLHRAAIGRNIQRCEG